MLVKVVFEIDGKEIELTEDGANKLRDEINRIFGPKQTDQLYPWPRTLYAPTICGGGTT